VSARVATQGDLSAVTNTLAKAFHSDPVWSWAFPDPERRLEQHRAVWGLFVRSALDHHWVWLADECAAAAVWIPPGRPELSPADEVRLRDLLVELLGDGALRVIETQRRFDAAHPHQEPHFYLSLLGTHPDHRGHGIGIQLLADTLARIDEEGMPAFLESTNLANDHRYERLGFVSCGEFELSEDGPPVRQMWRAPG
jgi:GNAT superfamily N-acetyltransferase